MAGATPKSKTSEITNRINILGSGLKDGEGFDMVEWQRLRKELEALESVPGHRRSALLLLAVLWEFKYDRDKIQSLLNQVAGSFGKDTNWYLTRANMAPTFGDARLITEMLEHGYPKDSRAVLDKVISMCSHSGMFTSAVRALDELIRLDAKIGKALEGEYPFLRPAATYLSIHGVPELDVANRVVAASRVVVDHQFRLTKYSVRSDASGLMFEFTLDGELDRLVEVDLAISDAIAAQFEGTLSQHLSIGVSPKEEAA